MNASAIAHANLIKLGWSWGDAGVVVTLAIHGHPVHVFVPLANVWHFFAEHFPMLRHQAIGCPQSVGSFWSRIKRAARSVSRSVKHVAKRIIPKKIRQAAQSVYRHAAGIVRSVAHAATSDIATYALMGLAIVPGMAPVSAGLLAAQQALKRIDLGVKAAQAIARGVTHSPQLIKALVNGRNAQRLVSQVVHNAATGQPVAAGFLHGIRSVAAGAAQVH